MARIGLDVAEPAGKQAHARLLHLPPRASLYQTGDTRTACYVIGRGFVLRRGVTGLALRAEGLAGAGEVLGLDGSRVGRHAESACALSVVDVAVVDLSALWSCSGLQARIVTGPQSVACLGHWQRHLRWLGLPPRERLAASLRALAQTARVEQSDLAGMSIDVADLAHWLAMTSKSAAEALQHFARQGLLQLSDGVASAFDTDALLAQTDPAPRAAPPAQAPGDSNGSS
jgi:CRP-like cAMP-binding protein